MRIRAHLPRDNALAIITDKATGNSACSKQRAHRQIRLPVKWGCAVVSSSIRDRTDLSFQLIWREMSCADRPVWTKETFSQTDSKYKAHRANQSTKCASRGFLERKESRISLGICLADNANHYLYAPKEYMFVLFRTRGHIFFSCLSLSCHHCVINI